MSWPKCDCTHFFPVAAAPCSFFFKTSAKVFPPPHEGATAATTGTQPNDSVLDETLDLSSALESSMMAVEGIDALDEGPLPPVDGGSLSSFPLAPAAFEGHVENRAETIYIAER